MNDRIPPHEPLIDDAVDAVRRDQPTQETVEAATARVWRHLAAESAPLRGCDDVRALLPAFVAGTLGERRALLVGDHTRECVACRRALMELRRGAVADHAARASGRTGWKVPTFLRVAAIVLLVVAAGALSFKVGGDMLAEHRLDAVVAAADHGLLLLGSDGAQPLAVGDHIRAREHVRTERDGGAMLRLADGSMVELDARSELSLKADRRGTTIDLARGNLLVHAADQGSGRLAVRTNDCEVLVKGTIFSVSNGLKGSRVSVVEGKVEVRRGDARELLLPGDQITTDASLAQVPVERDIAWSRNADAHIALLKELRSLRHDLAVAVEGDSQRSSSRLLGLAPEGTVLYAAMPNVAQGLASARSILAGRLSSSPTLRAWWDEQVAARGFDTEVESLLDRLRPLGSAVGEEIVALLNERVLSGTGGPVLLAELADPAGFVSLLQAEIDRLASEGHTGLVLVSDPFAAPPEGAQWLIWVHDDVAVAATSAEDLQAVAQIALDPSQAAPFHDTDLYRRLEAAYANGVGWLLGIDVHRMMVEASSHDEDGNLHVLEQLGLLDATTLVVEHHREGERASTQASLDFSAPRRGVAAWLAAPAPMGSLEFFSPQTALVSAAVAKDALEMFDDLVGMLSAADPEALDAIARFRTEHGIDLRADLAATLGGEGAFGIDGPVIPVPSWKLVLEVYDPVRLQATLEAAVVEINHALEAEGKAPLTLARQNASGQTFWVLTSPESATGVAWVMSDGYLVAGPNTAVLRHALMVRSSGVTLPRSNVLRDLLPTNGYSDCSALFYHDFGDVAQTLAGSGLLGELPPGTDLSAIAEPSLFCVWAEPQRISVGGTGASLLEAFPLFGLGGHGQAPRSGATGRVAPAGAVSSQG